MATIGTLNIARDDHGKLKWGGSIKSLEYKGEFRMFDNKDIQGEGSPTHLLTMRDADGTIIIVGKAWEKEIQRGDYVGRAFYSMSFDEPSLPDWMGNIAAFPSDDEGRYDIVYSRPKKKAA